MSGNKPLGRKAYGSIPHLSTSRLGPGEHKISSGQEEILTVRTRDRHDTIIVQEKLDGSNVAIANAQGEIVALTRAGYRADQSPYAQHRLFAKFVEQREDCYRQALDSGDVISGEWLAQAHGTKYDLTRGPFAAFDLWHKEERVPYEIFLSRLINICVFPRLLHLGGAISVRDAKQRLGRHGWHGATDKAEGVVYRCERRGKVEFLAKYVNHDKVDGKYFVESTNDVIWNSGFDGWLAQ